jgi:hypothetical protein
MLARTLAAAWLCLAAAGAAPATAQVVDTPHWLGAVTGSQGCDGQSGDSSPVPYC